MSTEVEGTLDRLAIRGLHRRVEVLIAERNHYRQMYDRQSKARAGVKSHLTRMMAHRDALLQNNRGLARELERERKKYERYQERMTRLPKDYGKKTA